MFFQPLTEKNLGNEITRSQEQNQETHEGVFDNANNSSARGTALSFDKLSKTSLDPGLKITNQNPTSLITSPTSATVKTSLRDIMQAEEKLSQSTSKTTVQR